MGKQYTGNVANAIAQDEHRSVAGVEVKAVVPYLFDPSIPDGQGGFGVLVPGVVNSVDNSSPATISDVYAALKYIANLLARPGYVAPADSTLRVNINSGQGTGANPTTNPYVALNAIRSSGGTAADFNAKDGLNNSIDRTLWADSIRQRIS